MDETGYVLLERTRRIPKGVLANFTGRDEAVACLEHALMRGVKASLITREVKSRTLRSQTSLRRR